MLAISKGSKKELGGQFLPSLEICDGHRSIDHSPSTTFFSMQTLTSSATREQGIGVLVRQAGSARPCVGSLKRGIGALQ